MEMKLVQTTINRSTTPLYARDRALCQHVFDDVRTDAGVARESEEGERIAAIVVELYRQGVQDPGHLRTMVQAARGLFQKQAPA